MFFGSPGVMLYKKLSTGKGIGCQGRSLRPRAARSRTAIAFGKTLLSGNTRDMINAREVQNEMSNVGDFIKERRLAKGMSKRALSEKAGISHSEVHRIENGERLNPSVPMLIALADALGIPQDDILMLAGYRTDGESTPLIKRVFPDLKTPKQQETAQKIVDGLSRNSDLKDSQYDELVRQVEMYLDYAKKNPDT